MMASQNRCDEKTVLTLLDVYGSCITDVFYNHLYDRAIAVHEKTQETSLTECYRRVITEYIQETSSARFYTVLLNSLHHYVRMSTIYNDISYPDTITLYTGMFVPQMYIASLTADQKMNILSMVMKNSVTAFANEIMEEHISCIIDDHGDHTNIEVLQDAILKILLHERETNYKAFVESQRPTKKSSSSKKVSSSTKKTIVAKSSPVEEPAPKVSPQTLVKLSNAFKKSVNERMSLKKRNLQLTKKNKLLIKQFEELKVMFLSQIKLQKEQTKIIEELKEQMKQPHDSNDTVDILTEPVDTTAEFDDDIFSVQYVEA